MLHFIAILFVLFITFVAGIFFLAAVRSAVARMSRSDLLVTISAIVILPTLAIGGLEVGAVVAAIVGGVAVLVVGNEKAFNRKQARETEIRKHQDEKAARDEREALDRRHANIAAALRAYPAHWTVERIRMRPSWDPRSNGRSVDPLGDDLGPADVLIKCTPDLDIQLFRAERVRAVERKLPWRSELRDIRASELRDARSAAREDARLMELDRQARRNREELLDRDRGEPRGSTPPTPPCVRVRTRRFEQLG